MLGKLPRPRAVAFPLAVAALAIALYAPTLRTPMQWDDRVMFVERSAFSDLTSIGQVLATPFRAVIDGPGGGQPYYRPASLALLAAEHRAFGPTPTGFRIVHASLHVLCCLLVYALLLELLASRGVARATGDDDRPAAAAGAALFAVAPYGVDTVLFLSSVGDQLVLASTVAALLAGAAFCRKGGALPAVALAASSAVCVLSKESGAVLPALLAGFSAAVGAKLRSRRFAAAFGVTVLAVAGLLVARAALVVPGAPPVDGPEVPGRALSGLGAAARFALAPHPLGLEVAVPASVASPEAIAGIVVLAGFGAAAWPLRRWRPVAFGVAWWLLTLAPSLVAVARTGILSSRYLYVPALGVACAAACACAAWRRPAFLAVSGLGAAWLLFAALRVFAWSDDTRLWSREAELAPERSSALINLSSALWNRGNGAEAEAVLRRAIPLARAQGGRGREAYARGSLCAMLAERREMDEALGQCRAALEADAGSVEAWLALGGIHAADGAWDKALRAYQEAMLQAPGEYLPLVSAAGAAAALGERLLVTTYLDAAEGAASGDPARRDDLLRRRRAALDRLRAAEGGAR